MEKRELSKDNNDIRRERFEFMLMINDNIIVQRFFKMNGFNDVALWSLDLKSVIDEIVSLIDEDLKSKSRVYTWYYYNSLYDDAEFQVKPFTGVGKSLPYKGEMDDRVLHNVLYDGHVEENGCKTYLNTSENVFKFVFKVDGKDVITKIWSADEYPVFVRNSVDITNKKYSFDDADERRMTYESLILRKMSRTRENGDKLDLIPIIIKKLCDVCTNKSYYKTKYTFG